MTSREHVSARREAGWAGLGWGVTIWADMNCVIVLGWYKDDDGPTIRSKITLKKILLI
jgi:hypothetical protein